MVVPEWDADGAARKRCKKSWRPPRAPEVVGCQIGSSPFKRLGNTLTAVTGAASQLAQQQLADLWLGKWMLVGQSHQNGLGGAF